MSNESLGPRALEAQVLSWTVRSPLVPSGDLELLTRAPADAVRLAVDTLDRHGWIERLTLHSADYDGATEGYALRPAAIPAFARAFEMPEAELRRCWLVERRDLLDRVASFEVTDSVNRFLTGVAHDFLNDGYSRLVDLRALPRRRAADREWPPLMDAYGCVAMGYDARPFFVAWDRGAAPAKHRAARVAAWYGARGDDDWPTVLIVCPGDKQRREWERAIRISAYRRDTDPLEVAFTTTDEAFGKQPTGDRWRFPGEDYLVSLFGAIRPVGGLLAPLPQPSRLDLLDRGVGGRTQMLAQWAAGVLASGRSSGRERVAALRLTLEPAHRTALVTLAHHPYLTALDLSIVCREEPDRVEQLLTDLERYGLVGSLIEEPPCP